MSETTTAVAFTQSLDEKTLDSFNKKYDDLVKFAKKNGYRKPKKGDFLAKVIKRGIAKVALKNFF